MKMYTLDIENYTANLNAAKDILLEQLYKDKYLTKEQYENTRSYAFVLHHKGFFGNTIESVMNFFKKSDNAESPKISLVRVIF